MAKNLRSNVLEGGLTVDPTVGAGVAAAIGSILPRRGTTELWQKIGAADTAWQLFSSLSVFSSQGWYGSGVDGAHTVVGTETLTRVMEWTTLVVPNGAVLNTDGWYFLCTTSVVVEAGGTIRCNGNGSVGSAGGAGGGAATRPYQVGGTGGSGQTGAGSPSGTLADQPKPLATAGAGSSRGGPGGAAGANAGGAAGAVTLTAIRWSPLQLPWCLFGSFPQNALTLFGISNGGGGGGGAGGLTGMGGGGGGGGLGFAAPTVQNSGAIQALGGTPAAAVNLNTGGGGGGGGGKIFVACRTYSGTQPDASGGAGGAGNGTGLAGTAGNTGYVQVMTGV